MTPRPARPPSAPHAAETPRVLYERLVREHAASLYRVAFRLCGHAATAEDLLQDTYVEAWRSIGRLERPGRGRAWLHAILRHRYFHHVRRRASRPAAPLSDEQLAGVAADVGPDTLTRLGDRELVQRALDALPVHQREALVLVHVEGLDSYATAERLGISRGTVLSRIHRARRTMRAQLRAHDLPAGQGAGR